MNPYETKIENRFDAFVFDLDGTLLDTLPDLVMLTNLTLQQGGFPPRSTQEIQSFVGDGVKPLVRRALPASASQNDVDTSYERWKALYPQYDHNLTKPYPGIQHLLEILRARGIKLGVLSNKFEKGVKDVIAAYLPGFFAITHGESADIPRKPDPTGLLRTINELNTTAQHTVYVGDSTRDVEVARRAGTYSAAVTWGYHTASELCATKPDLLISEPAKLIDLALS